MCPNSRLRSVYGAQACGDTVHDSGHNSDHDLGHVLGRGDWSSVTVLESFDDGGPRKIRTPDLLIRSQALYPAELWVRVDWRNLFKQERESKGHESRFIRSSHAKE